MVTPTGCAELDAALGGGLPIGLTLVLGEPKVGKSMTLSSLAAEAWVRGKHVLFASLEMSAIHHKARVFANLTATPMADLFARRNAEARARFDQIEERLGLMRVQVFPVDTSVGTLLEWVDRCVEAANAPADLVLVDAMDFLTSGRVKARSDLIEQRAVAEKFAEHAKRRGYCMAATTPLPPPKAWPLAGSFIGAAEQVLILDAGLDPGGLKDRVAFKVECGPNCGTVGPLLTDRARGRMWPVSRPGAEW